MNPNWLGVVSAVLAVVAFYLSYRAGMGYPVRWRIPCFALALLAAVPGASFALYYLHVLPEPAWYYQFRSMRGTELLVILPGIAGGLFATWLPRMARMLPLVGVVGLAMAPILKPFIGPIPADSFVDGWDGGVCLQSTPSTCGAASMVTILGHFGIAESESRLAKEAHSYAGGTEAWYLARAVRARGLDARFDFGSGFSPEGGLPAVVGVRLGSIGHFIAVLGRDGDRFVVGDPLNGREVLSRQELEERYDFTGFHLRINREG